MSELTGRIALVTGGSRGIGYATAAALLEAGARVALIARDRERLARAREALAARGEAIAEPADVTDYAAVARAVESVRDRLQGLDILVNNAGVAWAGPFAEQPAASIDALVDVNVKGALHAARAALPGMLARGAGVIVNVSSGAGRTGIPELAAYCASKFAVNGFTEALAEEVGPRGVRVFAVCPGRVATDMQREVSGRRQGMAPERVAETIVALCGRRPRGRPGRCLEIG